ncbi:phage late control D family protein [Paenibacillus thailandensis]|uniref:Phage late control D family protein n=1 Tax=Paenibacillus thailandensis TaxID=393250 RepID=A0ABW5QYS9_9BACL
MDFAQLEKKYGGFYAPAFEIRVDGKELRGLGLEIAGVTVDQALRAADHFSFTVNNLYGESGDNGNGFDLFLPAGKKVEIRLGYAGTLEPVLTGVVASIATGFDGTGSPRCTVSGYDLSYPMMRGMKPRSWDNARHSDIAAIVAAEYGLRCQFDPTDVVYPKVMKAAGKSDFHFLQQLADENYYECFVSGDTLYFRKPPRDGEPLFALEWRKQLLSFQPEVNFAEQVTEVEVRGWNPKTKKEIVGVARTGDEAGQRPGPGRKTGGELVRELLREPVKLNVRHPVFSQQEAEQLARSILNKHAEGLVRGGGETIGLPDIRPGRTIRLEGLGARFSKPYYVEKSVHAVSASGYHTTFHVKESMI